MKIISHRGESKYAPENTMSAFYLAEHINSDGIECDIRKTKDNQLVLIHDKTINRTSNGKGEVSNYTYDELLNFNFGDNEKIVKLTDFLNYFSNKNLKIYLEVKEPGYERLIYDQISKYNLDNITLISFKYEILEKFRIISNKIKLGWLVYDINNKVIQESIKIRLNEVLVNSISIEKKEITKLHENNIEVACWGIKNKTELKRISKLKVDTIIYDSGYDAKKVLENE